MAAGKTGRAPQKASGDVPNEMVGLPGRLQSAMAEYAQRHGLKKISQHEVAAMAELTQPVVNKLLRAKSLKGATAAALVRIAHALEIMPGWLLTGEGPKARPRQLAAGSGSAPTGEVVFDQKLSAQLLGPAPSRPSSLSPDESEAGR